MGVIGVLQKFGTEVAVAMRMAEHGVFDLSGIEIELLEAVRQFLDAVIVAGVYNDDSIGSLDGPGRILSTPDVIKVVECLHGLRVPL